MQKFLIRKIIKKEQLLNLQYYNDLGLFFFKTAKGSVLYRLSNFVSLNASTSHLYFFSANKSSVNNFIKMFKTYLDGISIGFFFELSLRGIGFKCYYFDNHSLFFSLGYSHYIIYKLPFDVVVFLKKGRILLYTLRKELLGSVVNDLKNLRIPDAYKAKGVVESNKMFSLKEGKKR